MMKGKVLWDIVHGSLFTVESRILVAVSGGADSVCLLHLLASLPKEHRIELIAAHLNHGFRDEESDEDARYVEELAESLGIESVIGFVDVPAMREQRHLSAQEAAREARHSFLRQVMTERGADRIALGHTRDDRVETVLGNILRGAGLEGLAAMPPKDLPLIRPLYNVTRAETHAYCAEHNLNPRIDSSNADLHYRRNRLRLELLPELRTHYNSQIDIAILRLAELAEADNATLELAAGQAKTECTVAESDQRVVLDSEKLLELPLAFQRRIIRQAILQIRGSLENISFETIEYTLPLARGKDTESRTLSAWNGVSVRLRQEGHWIAIETLAAPSSPVAWEIPLAVPGITEIAPASLTIETEILPFGERRKPMSGLQFPLAEIELPLIVRSRRNGDRITWGKPHGTSKVQDILTDCKIPKEQRDGVPIIADNTGKILCVGNLKHCGAALNPHSVLPPDEQILELRFHRMAETDT